MVDKGSIVRIGLNSMVVCGILITFSGILLAQNMAEKESISAFNETTNSAESTQAVAEPTAQIADQKEESQKDDEPEESGGNYVRRFHEVLDALLAEFGYDVKMGQLKGLKNLAIRKIVVSNTLPRSYTSYVELLVAERIRENSRVRLISCVPCKTKTSRLANGKLYITSPMTNLGELTRAAEQLGIDNFMDVVLVYHTTHMVLALNIFNTSTKELVWARTYNSETIKSRYQRLAVDYSQIKKSRPGEDYVPSFRYMVGLGGTAVPNVAGTARESSMLALYFRGTEKFNNRKNEFGLLFGYYQTTSSIIKNYPTEKATNPTTTQTSTETQTTEDTPKPFSSALSLYAIFSHNFLGKLESYNAIRQGVNLGLGVFLATGYLAATGRLGYDLFFGKSFTVSFGGIYIAPSEILVNNEFIKTKGGSGGDVVFSYIL